MAEQKIGPAGGGGGKTFDDYSVPENGQIREIRLLADRYINALQIIYTDDKDVVHELPPIGGLSGDLKVFTMASDEYLLGISGQSGWYVDSLRFHTNKRISETFGGPHGYTDYLFEAPSGSEVVGFFGRADWYVDALGIITRPRPGAQKTKPKSRSTARAAAKKTTRSKSKKKPDLLLIEGIGPKIAELLEKAGIPDLEALAKAPVDTLKKVLNEAGRRYKLADPTTWPEQAKLAAKEAWDALEELQKKLKGGRKA